MNLEIELVILTMFTSSSGNNALGTTTVNAERVATQVSWRLKPTAEDIEQFTKQNIKTMNELGIEEGDVISSMDGDIKTSREKCAAYLETGEVPTDGE